MSSHPPLLAAYKGSSEEYIVANLQLAFAAAKQLATSGLRVQIVLPDATELRAAETRFATPLSMLDLPPGGQVSFGAISGRRGGDAGAVTAFFFGRPNEAAEILTDRDADVHLAVNMSCVELAELEAWAGDLERRSPESVLCCFNLELETHRGDLGLPGFPGKALQNRFLSRFKPAFFLRQRSYSKTVNVAPFLLNYSGATFREYPGPWQVMLKSDSGELAVIAERRERYGLGEAKEEMMAAMGLNTEEVGSGAAFLRRGYKTQTWWEEGAGEAESDAWRS